MIKLKALNRFPPKAKFRMEGLDTARSLQRKGDNLKKLGLGDAYYAVSSHRRSRKYLRFQFKGTTYEFRCLPIGLSLARFVFTIILHLFWPNRVQKGNKQPSTWTIFYRFTIRKTNLATFFFMCGDLYTAWAQEMLFGTNSSLSLSGCGARHNLHVSCPDRGTYQ